MTKNKKHSRNDTLFDGWSIVHIVSGIGLGWIVDPFVAVVLLVLWEPFEILVLSPLLAKRNIVFGFESMRNALSDIIFDIAGVILGLYVLKAVASPPFYLF